MEFILLVKSEPVSGASLRQNFQTAIARQLLIVTQHVSYPEWVSSQAGALSNAGVWYLAQGRFGSSAPETSQRLSCKHSLKFCFAIMTRTGNFWLPGLKKRPQTSYRLTSMEWYLYCSSSLFIPQPLYVPCLRQLPAPQSFLHPRFILP